MTRFSFDTSIERDGDEIDVRVVYSVTPFMAATYWQPAEGGEVDLISVRRDGKPFTTSDAEDEALVAQCEARAADDMADEAAAADDWKYQEYRDRMMMRALSEGEEG